MSTVSSFCYEPRDTISMKLTGHTALRAMRASGGQLLSIKPGSVCLDCPRIAVARGRCAVHQREQRQAFDATRPTAHARGYDGGWRELRSEILRQQPWCASCGGEATEVHHSPRYVVGTDHRSYALTPMCKRCHSTITSKQVR